MKYGRIIRQPSRYRGYVDVVLRDEDGKLQKLTAPCSDALLGTLNNHWDTDENFEIANLLPGAVATELWNGGQRGKRN